MAILEATLSIRGQAKAAVTPTRLVQLKVVMAGTSSGTKSKEQHGNNKG
jgi:hypothetical protein